jgi:hypothetical protein
VRTEVELLVPRERLNARLRALGGGPLVEIVDLGAPFQVTAAGSTREYRDETRDCAYRARVAAVFIALVIEPGSIAPARVSSPPREPTPVAPPPPPRAPADDVVSAARAEAEPARPRRARVRLALGAAVEGGVGADARIGQRWRWARPRSLPSTPASAPSPCASGACRPTSACARRARSN